MENKPKLQLVWSWIYKLFDEFNFDSYKSITIPTLYETQIKLQLITSKFTLHTKNGRVFSHITTEMEKGRYSKNWQTNPPQHSVIIKE
jgi:hypothetical protein